MISYACWKRIGEHPQRVSDQVVLRRLATKDSENSDIIITVTTKLIRDTISARSLEVSSYHLDEPLFLSFVCSYDTLSSAPFFADTKPSTCCLPCVLLCMFENSASHSYIRFCFVVRIACINCISDRVDSPSFLLDIISHVSQSSISVLYESFSTLGLQPTLRHW